MDELYISKVNNCLYLIRKIERQIGDDKLLLQRCLKGELYNEYLNAENNFENAIKKVKNNVYQLNT